MIIVKYFASLREQLNCGEESLDWEPNLKTVADLKTFLMQRDANWQATLAKPCVLIAVDQQMAKSDTIIKDGAEIAFFPPVTGG